MDAAEQGKAALQALASSLLAAWNDHDVDRLIGHFSPRYAGVDVNDPAPHEGLQTLRESVSRYLKAFPDLRTACDGLLVDGNRVAVLWTARGTHQGNFMRIPPTRRPVQFRGVALLTVENGTICHGVYVWDTAGVLRDLGLLPHR